MKFKWSYVFLILALIVAGFFVFGRGSITGNFVGASGGVEIPLVEISEEAGWYEYNIDGTTVRFFAVRAEDGSIKTAFDACDVCYGSKKGYRQEGEVMICNNCGNRYPISGLGVENKAGGGCWPGYLPSVVKGNSLIVKESDLKKGVYRFE